MKTIQNCDYLFYEYKTAIEETSILNPQERNYQECIAAFFKKLLLPFDIQVIDVSKNRNTACHNRNDYTGDKGTPDLLLARNYRYYNVEPESPRAEYIAAIEVKCPNIKWNTAHNKEQLKSHLSKIRNVIFTDCYNWHFFSDTDSLNSHFEPLKSIQLNCDEDWEELQSYIQEFLSLRLPSGPEL